MMIMVATGVIVVIIFVINDQCVDCGYSDDHFGYLVDSNDQGSYLGWWVGMIIVVVIVITAVIILVVIVVTMVLNFVIRIIGDCFGDDFPILVINVVVLVMMTATLVYLWYLSIMVW